VDTCARCGTFTCPECIEIRASSSYCEDCARLLSRLRRFPRRTLAAAVILASAVIVLLMFGLALRRR
jgi:hypothetical protein